MLCRRKTSSGGWRWAQWSPRPRSSRFATRGSPSGCALRFLELSAIAGTLAGVRVPGTGSHARGGGFFLRSRQSHGRRLPAGQRSERRDHEPLLPSGSLSSDQQISLGTQRASSRPRIAPGFPSKQAALFDWPSEQHAAAQRQIRQLVADEVSGLEGFVLFDQSTRYEIDLAAASPQLQAGQN